MPLLLEQEGREIPGGFCMAHAFLCPPFLLGKLPWFFSGICSPGNWHQVSGLMLHYEIVNNVFRKGEELFRSSFCVFHFSYFPVSARIIIFVTVLDECKKSKVKMSKVNAHLQQNHKNLGGTQQQVACGFSSLYLQELLLNEGGRGVLCEPRGNCEQLLK